MLLKKIKLFLFGDVFTEGSFEYLMNKIYNTGWLGRIFYCIVVFMVALIFILPFIYFFSKLIK